MARSPVPGTVRRALDALYAASGAVAAVALVAIVVLVLAQVAARNLGFAFRGGADYAGYAMACASFFGFAYALNHGAHIRVALLLSVLGRHRFWGEVWCFGVGTIVSGSLAWNACAFVRDSWRFGERSQGLDATPLWIPQLAMAIGSVLLALAMADNLLTLLATRRSNVVAEELDGPAVPAGETP